jgi:hypothetical protein
MLGLHRYFIASGARARNDVTLRNSVAGFWCDLSLSVVVGVSLDFGFWNQANQCFA